MRILLPCLLLVGCAHSLDVTEGQAATLSPEARALLAEARVFDVPSFISMGDDDVKTFRGRLAEWQQPKEDALIASLGLTLENGMLGGVPVVTVTPRTVTQPGLVVFAVHGGGFTLGSPRDMGTLLLADAIGAPVVSVDYALAPEAKFPVASDQCLAAYRALVAASAGKTVVAFGHSAGSNLLLSTLIRARTEGLPLPSAVALMTPLVDLSLDGDSLVANDGRDIMRVSVGQKAGIAKYLREGDDPRAAAVSPLYAELGGLPPMLVEVGTRDLMLSGAARLSWKLREAKVPVELVVSEGMWHGFEANVDLPEAKRVRAAVAGFLVGGAKRRERGRLRAAASSSSMACPHSAGDGFVGLGPTASREANPNGVVGRRGLSGPGVCLEGPR